MSFVLAIDQGTTSSRAIVFRSDISIAATAQQYPVKMAELGVAAAAAFITTGRKPSGYTDTGVALIAAKPVAGVDSKDVATGMSLCFGRK